MVVEFPKPPDGSRQAHHHHHEPARLRAVRTNITGLSPARRPSARPWTIWRSSARGWCRSRSALDRTRSVHPNSLCVSIAQWQRS